MMRASALITRLAAACALALVAALVSPLAGDADPVPGELAYACALKSNGLLRAVSSPSECSKNEKLVTIKPGPVLVCVQPSGSTRIVTSFNQCKKPAFGLTLPPTSGTVYFCAAIPSGTLRYVTSPGSCTSGEVLVQVTPNDAAPSVAATSPADGATHVATTTNVTVTFSESVSVAAGAVWMSCNGTSEPVSVSGSPGTSLTIDPVSTLAEGVACSVTISAAGVSDTDANDPPDTMVSDATFSFTTDAAPALLSSSPADNETGVAYGSDLVLTFSEPVDVASGAFHLACGAGDLAVTVTGSGTATVTVNPDQALPPSASCTLSAAAADITDTDAGDPPDALASPVSIDFVTIDPAPSVTSTSPADNATHVATTTNVSVTFSEPVTAGTSSFSFDCDGQARAFAVSGSGTGVITLDPSADLPAGTVCTITAIANQISDVDAVDPPDHPAADYTFSFTVDAAPTVTGTTPADGASDVSPSSTVVVDFSEPVTVTQASFTLTCDGNAVAFALAGSGTDTVTLTPSADLPGGVSCTLTVVAAQVSDVDAGDPPDTMAADVTSTFTTTDTAPSVVSVTPADGATAVASNSNIVVTFSESVTTTGAAFSLECPSGTAVPFAFSGSPGSVITLDPNALLPAGETCTLVITASGVHDTDPVDPPDVMAADFTASFQVSPNSAPTDITLSNSTVEENKPSGTVVGTLTSTDPDVGDTFTYSLVSGTGSTDNGSFTIVGDELQTAASFDFETKSSYSVRIRTQDQATNGFEKAFTITVLDVNESPTDIVLSNSSVDENKPTGTVVGSLTAVDPDAGQTHTFAVVTSGCGGTFSDGTSFTTSGDSLVTSAILNYEVKSSYAVCLRTTDNGTPSLSFDKQFTITVNDVNDAPVAVADSYSGVIGNTLAVLGTTGSGPKVVLSGALPLGNDTDEDLPPQTLSAVAETVSSTGGGTATINTDGSFTFLPGVGDKSQTDTFTYHVTDGVATSSGTVSVAIGADRVWYVDGSGAAGDGRSSSPLNSLATLDGAGGAGDVDGTGDYVFVYSAATPYAGGLELEADQRLYGQPNGLAVGGTTLVAAGGTNPTITTASGNGVDLASGVSVQGVTVSGSAGDGIHGTSVSGADVGTLTGVTVTGSAGDGVELTGGTTGAISIAATVTGSAGRSVAVSGRSGGSVTFSGPITGPGVVLSSNGGATLAFTGALSISSGTNPAFSATGGGTVTSTNTASTLTSTTGTALTVDSTTIGANGLKFTSISANGALNGIRLNATGSSGGLQVIGGGSTSTGGDGSGGTIQNTTGAGISLTSTSSVSLNNLTVSGTPNAAGIDGTGVTGFSFTNGTVTGNGTSSHSALDASLAFNDDGATISNLSGAVTVTKSVFGNAYGGGLSVLNRSGAISSATVTGNTVTSPAAAADSQGYGISFDLSGSSSTTAGLSAGSISTNTVTGFPNGGGILLHAGNVSTSSAPTVNIGSSGSHVAVNGNLVAGASVANPMGTQCIDVTLTGRGTSYVDVTNNGTNASPLGRNRGTCVSVNSTGSHVLTTAITGNVLSPQAQLSGSFGIAGGSDKQTMADLSTLDGAVMNATINSNNVSSTTSSGIRFLANSSASLRAQIQNNTVAAPTTTTVSTAGIRVDSGTSAGAAVDTSVCLQISGNTTAGSTIPGIVTPGIGLRKQGTVSTTNDFGVVGLPQNPATAAETESYVTSQNPSSASGTFGTGGTAVISGSNFIPCTLFA